MNKYTSWDELPLMLSIPDAAKVIGISRSNMYQLIHAEGFVVTTIGSRYLIPKQALKEWIDSRTK